MTRPPAARPVTLAATALLVAGLILAAYLLALGNGFLAYDDDIYVTGNPAVRGGLTWGGLRWAFASLGYGANWHPLTWLSHMADVQAFGLDPRGHHLSSVLLHAASGAALFLLLRAMTGAAALSVGAALLFGLHPLHVESVAWVAERKDVLAGLWGALTLVAWLRYVRRPGTGRLALAAGAYGLGLMAKPTLVPLPAVLLVLDWWPLGRLRRAGAGAGTTGPGRLLAEKAPLFALAGISAAITVVAQARGRGLAPLVLYPFPARVANAAHSAAAYLGQTFWPRGLSAFYPYPPDGPSLAAGIGAAALLAGVTALAWTLRRRAPCVLAGWAWYLLFLLPALGLIQVGAQARADRYTYLPLTGVFLAVLWGGAALVRRRPLPRRLAAVLLAALVMAAGLLARAQLPRWRDTGSLFAHALEVTRDNWLALYNLGTVRARERRLTEAVALLGEAARLRPGDPEILHNLGTVLLWLGRPGEAERALREAVRLRPDYPESRHVLGLALRALGRPAEARGQFAEALRLDPGDRRARAHLAELDVR